MSAFILCCKLNSVSCTLILCFPSDNNNWLLEKLEKSMSETCSHHWRGTRMLLLLYNFLGEVGSLPVQRDHILEDTFSSAAASYPAGASTQKVTCHRNFCSRGHHIYVPWPPYKKNNHQLVSTEGLDPEWLTLLWHVPPCSDQALFHRVQSSHTCLVLI